MKGVKNIFDCKKNSTFATLRLGAICRVVSCFQFVGVDLSRCFRAFIPRHHIPIIHQNNHTRYRKLVTDFTALQSELFQQHERGRSACCPLNLVKSALDIQLVLHPIHPFFSCLHPPPILILECPGSDSCLRQVPRLRYQNPDAKPTETTTGVLAHAPDSPRPLMPSSRVVSVSRFSTLGFG
jgi:hypothetical protein